MSGILTEGVSLEVVNLKRTLVHVYGFLELQTWISQNVMKETWLRTPIRPSINGSIKLVTEKACSL